MIKGIINPGDTLGKNLREKIEDAFDVNFAVSEIRIDNIDSFKKELYNPYSQNMKIYYRGEKISSESRRLVPTFLRSNRPLENCGERNIIHFGGRELFDFYTSDKAFLSVYEKLYSKPQIDKMYNMTAFAQHYLDISPFVDFSKSLFVALSFAIKGRTDINGDIVIYTAFDIDDDDTTSDENEVNNWLANYNVNIIKTDRIEELNSFLRTTNLLPDITDIHKNFKKTEEFFNGVSPTAKLIDIPTNDLMKYQQGVFLLLNDFSMIDSQYLTKAVRQSFVINKYVISGTICDELKNLIYTEAPEYRYECLLDIARAVRG